MPNRLSKIFIITAAMFFVVFLFFQPTYNANAALVTCGTTTNPTPCGVCDILVLGSNIINFVIFTMVPAIAVLLYLIAGFLILLGGANPGFVSTGKSIFKTTTGGVIIVFTSWMITNTVLKSLAGNGLFTADWNKVTCSMTSTGQPIYSVQPTIIPLPPAISGNLQKLAQQVLASGISLSTSADCGNSFHARGNVEDIAAGRLAAVCSPTCKMTGCQPGGASGDVSLNSTILAGLLGLNDWMRQKGITGGFTITSLMTGEHSSASSAHYTGEAVDIVPGSTNPSDWQDIRLFLKGFGGTPICEGVNGSDVASCVGVNHIHWTLRKGQ